MDKEKFCLYCAQWQRLDDDHAIGKCSVHNGYRFQYEDCPYWSMGDLRTPYSEKELSEEERDAARDEEIERLILSGRTRTEARAILHCDYATINKVMKERGLSIRKVSVPKRQSITGEAFEQVVNYYRNEKKSKFWIAKKMGFTQSAVRCALIRAGAAQ